jgi:hypothetical protein
VSERDLSFAIAFLVKASPEYYDDRDRRGEVGD